jgi:hypothetical protein
MTADKPSAEAVDVLAVLERMRAQADYGRCADTAMAAKEAIRQIDEDRAALSAVSALIDERDALMVALTRLLRAYAFQKPPGYPKSDAQKIAEAALARTPAATGAPK